MARTRKTIQPGQDGPLSGSGVNSGKLKLATTILVFCVAALLALGMVALYSSSMAQWGTTYLVRQLIWCVVGLVVCAVIASVDYRVLQKLAWPLLAVTVVLLVMVMVPGVGGKPVNGARRWFGVGAVSFQPSELAKITLVIALAHYGARYQRHMPTLLRGMAIPGAFIGLVLGLIFIEPDRGTTILLAAVSGALLLIAGVRWKFFVPPVVAAVVGLLISLWLDPMRSKRMLSWIYLEENKSGVGYQAYHAMLALGSGGLTGRGLGEGRQKLGFVPFSSSDFIFSVIGEELGLIATLLVVLAFVALMICGIYIAWNSRELFGLLLGSGITLLIALQAFINIGVVTSALPNKGLPLPFISYGGSNLLIMLTCVGLLISIARKGYAAHRVTREATEPIGTPVLNHS